MSLWIDPIIRSMTSDQPQSDIEIREISSIPEMRDIEELQKVVWGVDDREVFPALAMRPITAVGGVLIGAFAGSRLVGFVFGFPGIENGRISLHSDMLAVKNEYRSRGIGYLLKLAQREAALKKGIETITWTFDPLQSVNAHLNFSRLGVVADRYLVNFYGQTTSFLHRSGTDRLWLTWCLNSSRVKSRIEGGVTSSLPSSNDLQTILCVGENSVPELTTEKLNGKELSIEIPAEINQLALDDLELLERWRESTRSAFTHAIDRGYRVEEFHRSGRRSDSVGRYVLVLMA